MNDAPPPARGRLPGGLTLRTLVPNAITAGALVVGLTGIRFAIAGEFEKSVLAIIAAGVLDGIDGRTARLLKGQSRFGAELDSLADSINFGVAPALIVYLWTLQTMPSLGWIAALSFAICCVLRLARFNARIDLADQPLKSAGFLTGVPAPVGAGLAFLPLYLWFVTERAQFADPRAVSIWLFFMAFLLISNLPTLSWSKLRPRRNIRLELIAVTAILVGALITEPWLTLVTISIAYLLLLPVGIAAYARFRQQRGEATAKPPGDDQPA